MGAKLELSPHPSPPRIESYQFRNWRSFSKVDFPVGALAFVVGPNGAGKSNLAEGIDFVSDVYRLGLEVAVDAAGGFERIIRRVNGVPQAPCAVGISVALPMRRRNGRGSDPARHLQIAHEFAFKIVDVRRSRKLRVTAEEFRVHIVDERRRAPSLVFSHVRGKQTRFSLPARLDADRKTTEQLISLRDIVKGPWLVAESELEASVFSRLSPILEEFTNTASSARVYAIEADSARDDSARQHRPTLSIEGENLPAVVDYMKANQALEWRRVMATMRRLDPDLKDIIVASRVNDQATLRFATAGKDTWASHETSDGTIRLLAMLVGLFDPICRLVVVEEPENSLHPWVARGIMEALREASSLKTVIVTSHSPVLLHYGAPDEVFLIWKTSRGSQLRLLRDLDPSDVAAWERGEVDAFDILDSGVVKQGLPTERTVGL